MNKEQASCVGFEISRTWHVREMILGIDTLMNDDTK